MFSRAGGRALSLLTATCVAARVAPAPHGSPVCWNGRKQGPLGAGLPKVFRSRRSHAQVLHHSCKMWNRSQTLRPDRLNRLFAIPTCPNSTLM